MATFPATARRAGLADARQVIHVPHQAEGDTRQAIFNAHLVSADTAQIISAAYQAQGDTLQTVHVALVVDADALQRIFNAQQVDSHTGQIIFTAHVVDADTLQEITPNLGFAFGSAPSQELSIILLKGSRPQLLPGARDFLDAIPGRHGVWDFGAELDSREFVLQCAIVANSREELNAHLRVIAAEFNPARGLQRFAFDREPDKYYLARASRPIVLEQSLLAVKFTLTLVAPDPFAYGREVTRSLVEGESIVANAGTWEAPFELTLTAAGSPVVNPRVDIGDQYIRYFGEIPIGQSLVIDAGKMTATLGGSNALGGIEGTFPLLAPGDNTVALSKASGGTLTGTLRLRPRWL
ncbi:MAG: distal tail protein Dit [Candidatus Desulforudaceae bacterium]